MIPISDPNQPDRLSRREVLRAGALGAFGLSLPQLLAAEAAGGRANAKPMSCILIFAWGGPAQHETFDMKPEAPSDYRGDFQPIRTNVPGMQICEYLPRLARHADKF